MPAPERKAQILAKAADYFAEYGLTAQTRALADTCGVSQRLLYSVFSSKAELLDAVYEAEISSPFKTPWLEELRDRSVPIAQRLGDFYREYYRSILTRRWLRLFLFAALDESDMAPTYTAQVICSLLDAIVEETSAALGLTPPDDPALRHEIGWMLHGNISHLAIRRHIYGDDTAIDPETVVTLQVNAFIAALPAVLPPPARSGDGSA